MKRCEYDYEAESILITKFTVGIVAGSIVAKDNKTLITIDDSKVKTNKHRILGYRYTIEGIRELFQSYFIKGDRFTQYIIFQTINPRFRKPLWCSWIIRHILPEYSVHNKTTDTITFVRNQTAEKEFQGKINGFVLNDKRLEHFKEMLNFS